MGLHYSEADAALSAKTDPTTFQPVCIMHFPRRVNLTSISASTSDCLLGEKASYK